MRRSGSSLLQIRKVYPSRNLPRMTSLASSVRVKDRLQEAAVAFLLELEVAADEEGCAHIPLPQRDRVSARKVVIFHGVRTSGAKYTHDWDGNNSHVSASL